ncbi:hypothetical protein Tco_0720599 [Tanacetum coccineum]
MAVRTQPANFTPMVLPARCDSSEDPINFLISVSMAYSKSSYETPSSSLLASSSTLLIRKRYWGTSELVEDTKIEVEESGTEGTDLERERGEVYSIRFFSYCFILISYVRGTTFSRYLDGRSDMWGVQIVSWRTTKGLNREFVCTAVKEYGAGNDAEAKAEGREGRKRDWYEIGRKEIGRNRDMVRHRRMEGNGNTRGLTGRGYVPLDCEDLQQSD